jgi:hypothetical protein
MSSPQIVLFAIQSAVKFGAQMRAAYVDSTRNRELVLPLLDFMSADDPAAGGSPAARTFFLRKTIAEPKRLRELIDKMKREEDLDEAENQELVGFHREFQIRAFQGNYVRASDGSLVSKDALENLLSIRQWDRDPNPSALQRLAGSLVEIGIDYFAGPGAEKLSSKHAAAMKALFTGLDGIAFAVEPLEDLPQKLFTITLETVSANPQVFSGDADTQTLIAAATRGLLTDVNARMQGANDLQKEGVRAWGETVFRSLLSSTGTLLLQEPQRFLGTKAGTQSALVSTVGNAVLELVLNAPEDTKQVFTREALEKISLAALRTVAQDPQFAKKKPRLQALIAQLADDLGRIDGILRTASLPDVMALVLDYTAGNFALLWPETDDPKKNLALTAARQTLALLLRKPAPGERWTFEFGREEALIVVDAVLNDFVRNPGWLVRQAKLDPHLETALAGVVAVLRRRGDERLSGQLAVDILLSALQAAASRSEFLDKVGDTPLVAAAIDTVLAATLDPGADAKVAWRTVREEVMLGLVDTALEKLAESKLDPGKIPVLAAVVDEQVEHIKAGDVWSVAEFALQLATRLES